MEMEIPVIIGVVVSMIALVPIVIRYGRKRIKQRMETLSKLANHFGLDYYEIDNENRLKQALHSFKLFQNGRGHKASNLLVSRMGHLQQVIFDLKYVEGSGDNANTKNITILLIECPDGTLPSFTLSREFGMIRKVSNFFGMDDIDFDSHKTFSDQYLLKGEDEGRIRETFNSSVLDYFTEHPGLTVEGGGRYLYVSTSFTLLKPEEKLYQELMDMGEELSELFFEGHYG